MTYDPDVFSRPVQRVVIEIGATFGLLVAGSVLIWILEKHVGVPNASSVFLLGVVIIASRFGTPTRSSRSQTRTVAAITTPNVAPTSIAARWTGREITSGS